jgi:hypothetical protein
MTNTERRQMTLDCASPNQINTGFEARSSPLPIHQERWWRWLKGSLQSPLTFIFLVWAAMFLMTLLFLTFLD